MKLRTLFFVMVFSLVNAVPGFSKNEKLPNAQSYVVDSIEDASDRQYAVKLAQIIGLANGSIDISISQIELSTDPKDPIHDILSSLVEASKREVHVRIFFNTRADSKYENSLFLREEKLSHLRTNGVEVHFVKPEYKMNDQIIIVDEEFVLAGGLPWTREAFREGFGAATLFRSKGLAQKHRVRLEMLPLWDVEAKKLERAEGKIPVPVYLLKEFNYFPDMVSKDDGDAMKIALAVLRSFFQQQNTQLTLVYKELAAEIPADALFEKSAVAFQVLKALQRIEEYGLIKIEKEEADRANITVRFAKQLEPSVGVSPNFFHEGYAKQLTARGIFTYLVILYRAQSSGESPVWLGSSHNIQQDYAIDEQNFRMGVDELRAANLIEVYPFEMRQGNSYDGPAVRENRYLINPVRSLSEKLDSWTRLRDVVGEDAFIKAQRLAGIIGEPEDPKVISVYSDLLKKYTTEDVQAMSQHVMKLQPMSTPERLDYMKKILEYEGTRTFQLAS